MDIDLGKVKIAIAIINERIRQYEHDKPILFPRDLAGFIVEQLININDELNIALINDDYYKKAEIIGYDKCPKCGGTGKVSPSVDYIGVECLACRGSGKRIIG